MMINCNSCMMESYRASLQDTPSPISLENCPKVKMDLCGHMAYAREKGVHAAELSDAEKLRFTDLPPKTTLPLMG